MVFFRLVSFTLFVVFVGLTVARDLGETRLEDDQNPFVFYDGDFTTLFESQQGKVKVLKKFTESSDLFKGIENIRMLLFEANPLTFVIPSHWDSDVLFFVGHGRGTITLIFEDRRESFNIEKGHLMTIPAGITFYMINGDDQEKLILSGFVKPIDNSGHFVPFFGVGGQKIESFYYAFSTEVLETVFNTSSDRLHNIFSPQRNGVIVEASKEQIEALTAEEGTQLPPGDDYCMKEYGPCQLFNYPGLLCECGEMFMVTPATYLKYQDFDMYTSFSAMSKGCMNIPFHSTRAIKVTMVINGRGRFEMVTPHYEEGSSQIQYKKISADLKPGMLFVIPTGYPLVLMASQDENLETINFEFYAKDNAKFALAGQNNIMKNFQPAAKELIFETSAEEVDDMLNISHGDFLVRRRLQPLQGHTATC